MRNGMSDRGLSRVSLSLLGLCILVSCLILGLSQRPRRVLNGEQTTNVTKMVKRGGNLQTALDHARPGDTIVLEAGVRFVGPFTLPKKTGDSYITIQSSEMDRLPPEQRVTPDQAVYMPKIVSPGRGEPALRTEEGAHHFRLIGLEFVPADGDVTINDLITLGDGSSAQNTLAKVPHHLTLDRCYIHTFPMQSLKRGIALNSAETSILNSYIAGFKVAGQDSQAICGWSGPGPFRIINNYLEAAGENVMFGGATSAIVGLVPSDIEIRRNYFYKPLSWQVGHPTYAGTAWTVKNLFELKNARRVTIDGNVFENNWAQAQVGFAIQFTVRTSDSGSWAVIEDITFTNNIVRHSAQGINTLCRDTEPTVGLRRLTIRNNLFEDIGAYDGAGRWIQILSGCEAITIDHNTAFQTGNVLMFDGSEKNVRMVFTNNISPHNLYGVHGSGGAVGQGSLEMYWAAPYTFVKNVIPGADSTRYPPNNFYPPTLSNIKFRSKGDYRLAEDSPYKNAGTDRKDIGCDIDVLSKAMGQILEH